MQTLLSGRAEGLPYSFSRWTDVPATKAKWEWFKECLNLRKMIAFDPRTAVPGVWSLHPEDTLGMIFWTKDPTNLIQHRDLLEPYRVKIHITATGWEEVEKGAPTLEESMSLLQEAAHAFGPENVRWRFSPVPMVPDVVDRFDRLASAAAKGGLDSVFLAFLQENDLMPEARAPEERLRLLREMAVRADQHGVKVLLCNEDRLLVGETHPNLASGICAPTEDFDLPGEAKSPAEGCGCGLAVDPFTINESCGLGCRYCYAADKSLADRKRNTTRRLNLVN